MKVAHTQCLAAVLASILALACGQPSPGASSAGSGRTSGAVDGEKVCSLLTAAEIQSVLGAAPGAPRYEKPHCIWPSADGSEQHLVQLIVAPAGHRSYDEVANAYRESMDGADPAKVMHPIDGAGGLFAIGWKDMSMVQIYTRSAMVQVATFKHAEQHALDLAKMAVARLE